VPLEINKQHRARDDLLGIWLYSEERWGADQADRYLDQIDKAIRRLSDDPSLGVDFSHLREGYRRLTVARHRIFYLATQSTIEIIRVLHERMDADLQLADRAGD
jgi:toxin ParE1/3/4